MADGENKPVLSTAKSVTDWVASYYGQDAIDIPKAKKLDHINNLAQFGAICYIVDKNTKQAHTDLFESNYTSLDNRVAAAAEIIIKLLKVKICEDRLLTRADFDAAGGSEMFGSSPDYDKIVEDYIGDGGLVEKCKYQVLAKNSGITPAQNVEAIVADMSTVKADHAHLLSITSQGKASALSREELCMLPFKAQECASKQYNEAKSKRSGAEFETVKRKEERLYLKQDMARKTGKVATVAGVSVACISSVIGGVFWPALLLIPSYSLAKKWIPDMFQSAGALW